MGVWVGISSKGGHHSPPQPQITYFSHWVRGEAPHYRCSIIPAFQRSSRHSIAIHHGRYTDAEEELNHRSAATHAKPKLSFAWEWRKHFHVNGLNVTINHETDHRWIQEEIHEWFEDHSQTCSIPAAKISSCRQGTSPHPLPRVIKKFRNCKNISMACPRHYWLCTRKSNPTPWRQVYQRYSAENGECHGSG